MFVSEYFGLGDEFDKKEIFDLLFGFTCSFVLFYLEQTTCKKQVHTLKNKALSIA